MKMKKMGRLNYIKYVKSIGNFIKKKLWHGCFPVNFVKFLRTPFYTEHLWWLLLFWLTFTITSSNGQYSYPFIFSKDGCYPQQSSFRYKQRDLGLPAGQRDHNYCRIPSRCYQQESQLPVMTQWETQANGSWITKSFKQYAGGGSLQT